jgi:hypothetical protein
MRLIKSYLRGFLIPAGLLMILSAFDSHSATDQPVPTAYIP